MNYPAPVRPFIPARYKGGRQTPRAIVMHGTVSADTPGTARNIANWWKGSTSPKTSCHYVVDPREDIQCVGDHTVAFHCGHNTNTVGVELCDEQTGPASRWNDANSRAIIARAARLTAELCLAYGIEAKRPSISALRAKGPHGIYGHDDSRRAFGKTSHTDPRDFPWAAFLKQVRAEITKIKGGTVSKPSSKPSSKPVSKPISGPSHRVHVGHVSLRYNSTTAQKNADAMKIFALGWDWLTGTEALETNGYRALLSAARKYGYSLHRPPGQDCWIAVNGAVVDGKVHTWYSGTIVPGKKRKHSNLGLPAVRFKHKVKGVGWIGVGASHYTTRKQDPRRTGARAIAAKINALARSWGKGPDLFFAGIDANMSDKTTDPFFGGNMVTCWDETGKYPNTGHGNIDAVARRKDDRARCARASVIGDSVVLLSTDHKIVTTYYDIVLEK